MGVGAAIMLQSLIGTIGTFMGCCGNKQVQTSCYGPILLPFGCKGRIVSHFHKFSIFRLVAVSSLMDCWYWLLLLLRWHSWINPCLYLFRSTATLNLQLFVDCGSSAGALCLPRGCRDRGAWKTNCQNDICVSFLSFRYYIETKKSYSYHSPGWGFHELNNRKRLQTGQSYGCDSKFNIDRTVNIFTFRCCGTTWWHN